MNSLKSLLFIVLIVQLTACGGGGDKPAPNPLISNFSASEASIVAGDTVDLTAVFSNGTGSINNGVGSVSSNVVKSVSPTTTMTYTLTVTNSDRVSVTANVAVTVVVPVISSFTASPQSSITGSMVSLNAVFSNGSGSIDNGIGEVSSNVSLSVNPTTTTTYTLTVTNDFGVSVSSNITVTVAPIMLTIVSPADNEIVADDLTVTATIQSQLDIAVVQAVVGTRSVDLVYSADAICGRGSCTPGFSGLLSLAGLSPDTYNLMVTAEDVSGRSVSEQTTIRLDNSPGLIITEPLDYSVATPAIPVSVTCVDDAGDCAITVSIGSTELVAASNTLTETLDLTTYDGQQVSLVFKGTDSSNQVTTISRTIYVESSSNLTRVKDFSGLIIDFDGQDVLIKTSADTGDSLAIASISSVLIDSIDVPTGLIVSDSHSFLTPMGAIFTTREVGGNVLTANIYDWNNSQLFDLGFPNSASSLTVSGDYAIWSVGENLWRRQLSSKSNIQISNNAGNWQNAVGSNGVVGYWAYDNNYTVVKYESGINTTLATDSNYWNTYVESDGELFVYRKHDACCSNQQYAITLHDGVNETVLTDFRDEEPNPGRDYQVNNGWLVFTELGGLGQTHVWSRDAAGTLEQRTIYGSDSYIDTLSSDGEVMLINSGNRYLSDTAAQTTLVGSTLGKSSKANGIWYIAIGRSLFRFN